MALINQNSIIGVTSITSPSASNVLTVHTNDTTERLRVSTSGVSFSGTNASLDTSGNATFNGNVSIGGTLTYEDVTNIDSVGIVTARNGIKVTSGDVLLTGGDGRKISFAGDGSAHYFKMSDALNGPIINGYGGIAFETNGPNERLRIDSAGKVGLGTNNPLNPLHIRNDYPIIRLEATVNSYVGRNTIGGYQNLLSFDCDNDNSISNSSIVFNIDGSEKLRISSAGLVGINDIDPRTGLTIAKYGTAPTTNANTYSMPAGRWVSTWNTSTSNNIDYWAGFGGSGYAISSGSVNIALAPNHNNTSQQAGMYIAGEATSVASSDFTIGKLVAGSAVGSSDVAGNQRATKSELMRITSTGDVGIGTAVPVTSSGYANLSLGKTNGGQLELKKLSSGRSHYIWGDDNLNIGAAYNGSGDLIVKVNGNNERLRVTSGGDLAVGATGEIYGISRLSIRPDNRQTQFDASAGATWHDVVIKQNDTNSSGGNAVGLAFEISTSNYHNNAGTGIAAIKDSNSNDYGCHLAFITRPHSAVAEERMRIHATGEVTKSAQPRFFATLSSTYTGYDGRNVGGTWISYNNTIYNIGGGFKTSGSDLGLFVAPVDGMYLFHARAYKGTGTNNWSQSWFDLDGSRAIGTDWVVDSSRHAENAIQVYMTAGQKIGFHPYNNQTNNQIISTGNHTYFKGCLLG